MKLLLDFLLNNNLSLDRIELYIVNNKRECEFRATFSPSTYTTTPFRTLDLELLERFASCLYRSKKGTIHTRECLSQSGFTVRQPIDYKRESAFALKFSEASNQPFTKTHVEDVFAEIEFINIEELHNKIRDFIKIFV